MTAHDPFAEPKPKRFGIFLLIALLAMGAGAAVFLWKYGIPGGTNAAAAGAVKNFHEQLDDARFDEIYDAGTPALKSIMTKPEFTKMLDTVHGKLGVFLSSKQSDAHSIDSASQSVLFVTYNSHFENAEAIESFTFVISEKTPRLESYKIASKALEPPPPEDYRELLKKSAPTPGPAALQPWPRSSAPVAPQ